MRDPRGGKCGLPVVGSPEKGGDHIGCHRSLWDLSASGADPCGYHIDSSGMGIYGEHL